MYIPTTDKIIENPTGGVVETAEIKWQKRHGNERESECVCVKHKEKERESERE